MAPNLLKIFKWKWDKKLSVRSVERVSGEGKDFQITMGQENACPKPEKSLNCTES